MGSRVRPRPFRRSRRNPPKAGVFRAKVFERGWPAAGPSGREGSQLAGAGRGGPFAYADCRVRVRLASGRQAEGVFDRDGRLEVIPEGSAVNEADLAEIEVEILDAAS